MVATLAVAIEAKSAPPRTTRAVPGGTALLSPADLGQRAARDISSIPAEDRPFTRYLDCRDWTEEERIFNWRIMSGHFNSLSSESEMTIPSMVAGTNNTLMRIDLNAYGHGKKWVKLWDKLGTFDPYFHAQVKSQTIVYERTVGEGGHKWVRHPTLADGTWQLEFSHLGGNRYHKELIVPQVVEEEFNALAPWLSRNEGEAKALGKLAEYTQSAAPILSGDWFFYYTAIQNDDRNDAKMPGYYDFAGLKSQDDFEQAVGLDIKLVRTTFKREVAAAIKDSSFDPVAHNNRRIVLLGTIGGGVGFTLDARDGTGKKNYLRNIDTDTNAKTFLQAVAQEDEFDATEALGPGANGLFKYWLANNKRERQNSAPDFIASCRNLSKLGGTDARVHVGMTCVGCHVDGFQPLNDYVRRVMDGNPLELRSPDKDKAQRATQLYASNLDENVKQGQTVYGKAVAAATRGLTTTQYSNGYVALWKRYRSFDLDDIARKAGTPKAEVVKALSAITRAVGQTDPVLAGLLKGESIRYDHLEEVWPVLMTHLRGAVP